MANYRISPTMEEALRYLGGGRYRAHLEPTKATLLALERREMIVWHTDPFTADAHDTTQLWDVTQAGWAWLKAEYGMDRPADAGRLTLDEALEDVTQVQVNGRAVMISETEYAACITSWAKYGTVPNPEANDWAAVARLRGALERVEEERGQWDIGVFYRMKTLPADDAFLLDRFVGTIMVVGQDLVVALFNNFKGVCVRRRVAVPRGHNYQVGQEIVVDASGGLVTEEDPELAPAVTRRFELDEALAEAYTPSGQVTCEHGRGLSDTCDLCSDRRQTESERRDLFDTVKHANRPPCLREDWESYDQEGFESDRLDHAEKIVRDRGYFLAPPVPGVDVRAAVDAALDRFADRLIQELHASAAEVDSMTTGDYFADPDAWRAQESGSGAGAAPSESDEETDRQRVVEDTLGPVFPDGTYYGVKVPDDIRGTWGSAASVHWARGLAAAQAAARIRATDRHQPLATDEVSPPPEKAAMERDTDVRYSFCPVCRWSFSSPADWTRHVAGHGEK